MFIISIKIVLRSIFCFVVLYAVTRLRATAKYTPTFQKSALYPLYTLQIITPQIHKPSLCHLQHKYITYFSLIIHNIRKISYIITEKRN